MCFTTFSEEIPELKFLSYDKKLNALIVNEPVEAYKAATSESNEVLIQAVSEMKKDNKKILQLLKTVKGFAKMRKRPLKKLSTAMGIAPNYLTQKLKYPNVEFLLLELSDLLNVNLVEHYTALLPTALQTTHRERALLIELEQLKKELQGRRGAG